MFSYLRRPVASILILSLLLTNLPAPTAADQLPTVPAIDPLQVAVAGAPNPTHAIKKLGRVAALPESDYVPPSVKPLPFKPFDVADPSTGKKVSRSATIYLPHQHREVNAGKYYDDVNKLEESLNKSGYTLRSHAGPTSCKGTYSHTVVNGQYAGGKVSERCKTAAFHKRLKGSEQSEVLATIRYHAVNPGHPFLQPNVLNQLSKLDALVGPAVIQEQNTEFKPDVVSIARPVGVPAPKPPSGPGLAAATICKRCPSNLHLPAKKHNCTGPSWFPNGWYGDYWHWASSYPNGIKDKGIRLPRLCHMPPLAKLHRGLTQLASPWSTSFGSQSTASVNMGTNLQIGGDYGGRGLDTVASAHAGACLMGQCQTVASATANGKGRTGSVDLQVLGQSIYSHHGSGKFHDNYTYNPTFFSFQIPIQILWFTITLEGSVYGDFGVRYGMTLSSYNAGFFVEPFIGISGEFSANFGVGIVIVSVSVGVYGKLLIAQFSLPFHAHGKFKTAAVYTGKVHERSNIIACQLLFQNQISLDDQFSALSGQMGVQAQACVDLFFWSNCWTAQVPLFNWSGINAKDNIFKIPSNPTWTQVGPWYTDLPQYGYPLRHGTVFSRDDRSGEPAACHSLGVK